MLLCLLVPLLSYAEGWDEAKYKQIEQSIKQPQISDVSSSLPVRSS